MFDIKFFFLQYWLRHMKNDFESVRLRTLWQKLSMGYEVEIDEQTKSDIQDLLEKDAKYEFNAQILKNWSNTFIGLIIFAIGCWAWFSPQEPIWWLVIVSFLVGFGIFPEEVQKIIGKVLLIFFIGGGLLWGTTMLDEIPPTSLAILIGSIIIAAAIYEKK